jgi:hypothetical protein
MKGQIIIRKRKIDTQQIDENDTCKQNSDSKNSLPKLSKRSLMTTKPDTIENEKYIIPNNHILRKYFQNFKVSKYEIEKLKKKLNKFGGEMLLNQVINQGDSVYNMVNEYYNDIVDKLENISEQINSISNCVNFLQELNMQNFDNFGNESERGNGQKSNLSGLNMHNTGNSSTNLIMDQNHNSPIQTSMNISTKHFYLEKINKLKKLENEFTTKNKEISIKNSQLEEDSKFLEKIAKEKDGLIDSLSEDQLRRIGDSFTHEDQIASMKLILSSYDKFVISPGTSEKQVIEMFKVSFIIFLFFIKKIKIYNFNHKKNNLIHNINFLIRKK